MGQKTNAVYLLYEGHQKTQCHEKACKEIENG